MASIAPSSPLERVRTDPLRGGPLLVTILIVWVAGALYCSGYEKLLGGFNNWPGSLVWSAVAVLPWFGLFEWSKSRAGRRVTAPLPALALILVATAIASVALELSTDALLGSDSRPIALLLLRRLPAIGAGLLLILWSRSSRARGAEPAVIDESLDELAGSIDWLVAADNYVELHIRGRVSMRRMTMREAERALSGHGFIRIHRRYLVNRKRIRAVQLNGRRAVVLECGEELSVGRSYEANLAGVR